MYTLFVLFIDPVIRDLLQTHRIEVKHRRRLNAKTSQRFVQTWRSFLTTYHMKLICTFFFFLSLQSGYIFACIKMQAVQRFCLCLQIVAYIIQH